MSVTQCNYHKADNIFSVVRFQRSRDSEVPKGEHLELFRLLRRRVAVIWCKFGLIWTSIDGVIAVYGYSQMEVLDFGI